MVDVYLRAGEALPSDVRLRDPRVADTVTSTHVRERRQRASAYTLLANATAPPAGGNRRRRVLLSSE